MVLCQTESFIEMARLYRDLLECEGADGCVCLDFENRKEGARLACRALLDGKLNQERERR